MDSSSVLYILLFAAIVLGVVVLKKVTSCLFRILCLVVFVAILAYLYYTTKY